MVSVNILSDKLFLRQKRNLTDVLRRLILCFGNFLLTLLKSQRLENHERLCRSPVRNYFVCKHRPYL